MYHIYTIKNQLEYTKTQVGETSDYDEAFEIAEKSIENKPELKFTVEETNGNLDSYGELIYTLVAEG